MWGLKTGSKEQIEELWMNLEKIMLKNKTKHKNSWKRESSAFSL